MRGERKDEEQVLPDLWQYNDQAAWCGPLECG
jgi:hypothetical protein